MEKICNDVDSYSFYIHMCWWHARSHGGAVGAAPPPPTKKSGQKKRERREETNKQTKRERERREEKKKEREEKKSKTLRRKNIKTLLKIQTRIKSRERYNKSSSFSNNLMNRQSFPLIICRLCVLTPTPLE